MTWTPANREQALGGIGFANRRIVTAWIAREPVRPIPWTPLEKPSSACRVTLLSTAALARDGDAPFDQEEP